MIDRSSLHICQYNHTTQLFCRGSVCFPYKCEVHFTLADQLKSGKRGTYDINNGGGETVPGVTDKPVNSDRTLQGYHKQCLRLLLVFGPKFVLVFTRVHVLATIDFHSFARKNPPKKTNDV